MKYQMKRNIKNGLTTFCNNSTAPPLAIFAPLPSTELDETGTEDEFARFVPKETEF